MGNDVSAPAQGALPTGMPQNTGFSGLGQQPQNMNWQQGPAALSGGISEETAQPNFMGQPQYTSPMNLPSPLDTSQNEYDRYTGRLAMTSGEVMPYQDWANNQMNQFGVKYHKLIFGKPDVDLFIDDKAISAIDWDKNINVVSSSSNVRVEPLAESVDPDK